MERYRFRIRFAKQHDLRMISHRDLVRTLERLFRRAGLALSMSEGFHPKPRMSFPLPLAVGAAGLDEVMELELAVPLDPQALCDTLNAHSVAGLSFLRCEPLSGFSNQSHARRFTLEAQLPAARVPAVAQRLGQLFGQSSWPVSRKADGPPFDARPLVDALSVVEGKVQMRLWFNPQGSVRPAEILQLLGLEPEEIAELALVRTHVELAEGAAGAAPAADDWETSGACGAEPT